MGSDTLIFTQDQIDHAEVLWSFPSSCRKVLCVGSVVVKLGPGLDLTEAENMKFIREHTRIPVPKILNSYEKDGMGYILMDFIEGEKLETLWTTLSTEAKDTILSELSDYVRQMRQIGASPKNNIGSVIGGPAVDRRSMGAIKGGPFRSEEEFNAWQLDQLQPGIPLFHRDMYHAMHKTDHTIFFSHGDDWEDAGWFPEHWDFCKSAGHISGSDDLYLALKLLYEKQYFAEYVMDMWFTREVKHSGF